MYKSEAAFSRALVLNLKRHKHLLVQRIESGETGRGIPDLYLHTKRREVWMELKNKPYDSVYDNTWKIPWRPGQQAWMLRYKRITGKLCITVVALKDGFLWIPMYKVYTDNVVNINYVGERCTELNDIFELITSLK